MNLSDVILETLLSAGLALQAWTLIEIVKLKIKVAVLTQRIQDAGL